jgi:hypothetical protein
MRDVVREFESGMARYNEMLLHEHLREKEEEE